MKKILAILLIIVLGIALGVGIATWRIKASPWDPTRDEGREQDRAEAAETPAAAFLAVVI
jgi:flagellar basal body-associated protein FliL